MAEKKKVDGQPPEVKLPGDPITSPVELDLPLDAPQAREPQAAAEPPAAKPAAEAAPVAAAPDKSAKPADAPAAKKDDKPAEPQGNGPHNNYGVEEPTSSRPDAWLEYDEKLLVAKEAYEKEHKGGEPAAVVAAKVDEPAAAVDASLTPPPPREAPPVLAADEKFALEPGAEWTRGQIVNEIVKLREIRDDRDKAFGLFGQTTYEDLEKGWKPFLDKARANPGLVPFLDKMQEQFFIRESDPEFASFMDENADKFLAWRKENPGATPARKTEPTAPADETPAEKRLAALERTLHDERVATANRANLERVGEQVKTERLGLWKTYPVLQEEPALWAAIKNHAILQATTQREQTGRPATYTLTDAVRDQWPLVLKFMENRKVASEGDPTPVPVRAGGQEGSTVRTSDDPNRERAYASKEDAAKAWMLENPDGFKG